MSICSCKLFVAALRESASFQCTDGLALVVLIAIDLVGWFRLDYEDDEEDEGVDRLDAANNMGASEQELPGG